MVKAMTRGNVTGRRLRSALITAAVAMALAPVYLPSPGMAGGTEPSSARPADLIGKWGGTIAGIRPPQTITVTITAVKPDAPAGDLHFGGRRGCQLDLDYSAEDAAQHFFVVKRPTGGYCNALDFGSLALRFAPQPDVVTFTLSNQRGVVTDTGTIRRTAP